VLAKSALQAERLCPFPGVRAASLIAEDPTYAVPEQYRHRILNKEERELIKASVPVLDKYGLEITKLFYSKMLAAHPELKNVFNNANQSHFEQPRALAQALAAYASNIDDLGVLKAAIELIAAKHVSLYIQPEQYVIVGEYLIGAIAEVLGDALSPEVAMAWTAAYWQLAEVLIKRENELYQQNHGWTDWAEFKIAKKVKESDEVTSFYLEPLDKGLKPLPAFLPGQFISIQVDVPTLGHQQTRQYSLSEASSPDHYRISIKKEPGAVDKSKQHSPGLISNLMHDTKDEGDIIRVSHPVGDFFLQTESNPDAPLVLLSGGVGLTPLMAMLSSLIAQKSSRPVSWIHGARSASARAFTDQIRTLAQSRDDLQVTLFEDHPEEHEIPGRDYNFSGVVDLKQLDDEKTLFLHDTRAQYYICGPPRFMSKMESDLIERGVDTGRLHMEKFGTGGIPHVSTTSPA